MHRIAILAGARIGSNARIRASRAGAAALAAAFLLLLAPDAHAQGFLRRYVVVSDTSASDETLVSASARCPDGLQVLGGGVRSLSPGIGITTSEPGNISWIGRARRFGNTPALIEIEVAVVCGRVENYSRQMETLDQDSTSPKTITVGCPPGSSVLGGGVEATGAQVDPIGVTSSSPSGNGWYGRVDEVFATDENWNIEVHAICGVVPNRFVLDEVTGTDSVNSKTAVSPTCEELVPLSGGAFIGGDAREVINDLFPIEDGEWTSSAFEPTVHTGNWNLRTSVICAPEPGAATLALGAIATVGLGARRRRRAQLAEAGAVSKRRR